MLKTLDEICNKHKIEGWPDKNTVHSYLPAYEKILAPYRHTAKNVLEIGIFNGASLLMWEEYFTMADVYGMDCDEQPHGGMADLRPLIASGQHRIVIGDATDERDIKKYFRDIKFDVVIEDAGHDVAQQFLIYQTLKPYLNENSIYIIEDIQDIDRDKNIFELLGGEIIDLRKNKGRYDDVMVIIK